NSVARAPIERLKIAPSVEVISGDCERVHIIIYPRTDRRPTGPIPPGNVFGGSPACGRKQPSCEDIRSGDHQRVDPTIHAQPQAGPTAAVPLRYVIERSTETASHIDI